MSALSLPARVELISVHVHKTAGSTFGYNILPQIYSEENILYDNEDLSLETLVNQGKLTNTTRAIHGHFAARKYQDYFQSAKLVIWLRNPLIQLISVYCFWYDIAKSRYMDERHRYVVENKLDFSNFIELDYTQNTASRYYAGGMSLSQFNFVGIQEFFSEDLSELTQKLGKQVEETIHNKNGYPAYKEKVKEILEDKKLITRMVELKSKDLQLYHLALKMRAERKGKSNYLQMYEQIMENSRALMESFQVSHLK